MGVTAHGVVDVRLLQLGQDLRGMGQQEPEAPRCPFQRLVEVGVIGVGITRPHQGEASELPGDHLVFVVDQLDPVAGVQLDQLRQVLRPVVVVSQDRVHRDAELREPGEQFLERVEGFVAGVQGVPRDDYQVRPGVAHLGHDARQLGGVVAHVDVAELHDPQLPGQLVRDGGLSDQPGGVHLPVYLGGDGGSSAHGDDECPRQPPPPGFPAFRHGRPG